MHDLIFPGLDYHSRMKSLRPRIVYVWNEEEGRKSLPMSQAQGRLCAC
jgi:hypothetical protein